MINKVRLDELCTPKSSSLAQKDILENHGEYPVYGASGFIKNVNFFHQNNDYIAVIKDGAGIGRTMFLPAKSSIIGTMQYLVPNSNVDPKFLYYAVKSMNLSKYFSGATIPHIYFKDYKKELVPLFSKNKQKLVSSTLEKLEEIVTKKQQQLTEYDQLIKSRFVEMFESFEKTDLSNIAEIIMGQSPDSAYYNENGVGLPFFQGKADFGAKFTNVSYWTTKPSKTAKKGNVLMSVRAPVGPVNISSVDCCIGRGLCSINAIPNKTNNEFLYNALIAIQDQITAMGTGSTFKAINKSDVYAIKLPLAPISLQNEFANFVEQVDKLKFVVQQSLDETKKLFDSLMQKYFG